MSRPPSGPDTEFRVTDFTVSTEKVVPEKPYFVRVTSHFSAEAVERESGPQQVRDVGDVENPAVREVLEAVLREGEVWRDEIPDGLRELTEAVDFFTWAAGTDPDRTHTHWGVAVYDAHPDRQPVVEFDATLVDDAVAPGDPATVAFSLTNVGDHRQEVFGGTVAPFGVLRAERDGGRVPLWRDYEREGGVSVTADGLVVDSVGVLTPIEPGETIEKEYDLRLSTPVGDELAADDYVASGTLSYHRDGQPQGPSTEVEWAVEFSVVAV